MRNTCIILILSMMNISNAFELNGIFKDNMVLQRDQKVSIYGTAEPAGRVTVNFSNQIKHTVVGGSGEWELKLDAMAKSFEPHKLSVKSSKSNECIVVNNILVGDVWLCSGQSNMEYTLGRLPLLKDSVNKIDNPDIRGLVIEHREAGRPDDVIVSKEQFKLAWREMKKPWKSEISAAAYYFAAKLRKDLDVPIGLIVSAVGGSQIQRWMPREIVEGLKLDSESSGGAGVLYNST